MQELPSDRYETLFRIGTPTYLRDFALHAIRLNDTSTRRQTATLMLPKHVYSSVWSPIYPH